MTTESTASQLHNSSLVIDSHNDAIVAYLLRKGESIAGPDAPARSEPESVVTFLRGSLMPGGREMQVNIPKLRAGGIDVVYCAVDVTRAWGNHLLYAMDAFGWFLAEVDAHADQIAIATTAEEIEAIAASGRIAAVLTIENSEVLERSLWVLPVLQRLGVRSMTLTWSYRAHAADGAFENVTGGGLTHFGRDLVRSMNELGMIVDISHISDQGFWDVMDVTNAPIIGSHNACRALCEHPRNLTDDQIRAVADNGGVVGVTYVPAFVDADESKRTLDRLLDHFDHIAQVAGTDCVGLGSDFDGGGDVLKDATVVPQITEGLLARGWQEDDLRKMLGLNHLRVFRQVCG
ncbi:MAG: dipeptidase [Chloroflexi bacterium]|nr:dipeptidase [Chloroflexota bacterium]